MDDMQDEPIDFTQVNLNSLGLTDDEEMSMLNDDPEVTSEMKRLLEDCDTYWNNLASFRQRRARTRNYYRGHQWLDKVEDPDNEGTLITEEDLIINQGKIPMKNNQLRQLGKSLIGQYRDADTKPIVFPTKKEKASLGEMMTNALHSVYTDNELKEIDVRVFEEFLISGYIGWKEHVEWVPEKDMNDVTVDAINPTRQFWNTDVEDIRLKDLQLIGEIHDMRISEIEKVFANNDEEALKIRQWYNSVGKNERADWFANMDSNKFDSLDFYNTYDTEKERVFEVWRKELVDKRFIHDLAKGEYYQTELTQEDVNELNEQRLIQAINQGIDPEMAQQIVPLMEMEEKKEFCWYYYFLTPKGHILAHGESNYEHQSHPYTMRLYPLIDGEVWGFFEDIIDQQKQINRLITLLDFMIGASAKGVLMVPEDAIPTGWTIEDFAEEWTKFNGVIKYKPSSKHNKVPEQITANSSNAGAADLLNLELKLLQEISGVNEAIQGHKPTAGTPAALYAQQTNNAAISNKDFFEFFYSARKQRDMKAVQLIQQYYTETRWINVSGNDYNPEAIEYDPEAARDARFNVVIGQGNNNPVYRQLQDEWLLKFWESGGIDIEMLLENSALPFGDKLLESIRSKKEQLQQAGPSNLPPEMMQQLLGQPSEN